MKISYIKNEFIRFFKGNIKRDEKLTNALRELVNMLFAVVVGTGLAQIDENWNPHKLT